MSAVAWPAQLVAWYREGARDLPWRRTNDPYRVWLSEIMLQQTRVETVLPYYERFLCLFPDAPSLARAPEERVLKAWEGLGYYRRAMYFQRATQCVVRERGGEFPTSAAGWRQLPGIGAYTAGALASILNGEPVPAVDGNVRRVLARMHLVEGSRNDPDAARAIDMFAAASVPASSPGDYNQALMELGARVCTPRRPRCHLCPVAADCRAHAAGRATEVPAPRRAKKTPRRVVAAAMIEDRGRLLLVRRPDNGLLAGFWEFPGVVVRRGEKAERSLERAVMKSCGLRVRAGRRLGTVKHAYSHFELTLRVFECTPVRARTQTSSVANGGTVRGGGARWVPRGSLDRYAIHGAMKKAFAAIGERSNVRKETGRSG